MTEHRENEKRDKQINIALLRKNISQLLTVELGFKWITMMKIMDSQTAAEVLQSAANSRGAPIILTGNQGSGRSRVARDLAETYPGKSKIIHEITPYTALNGAINWDGVDVIVMYDLKDYSIQTLRTILPGFLTSARSGNKGLILVCSSTKRIEIIKDILPDDALLFSIMS